MSDVAPLREPCPRGTPGLRFIAGLVTVLLLWLVFLLVRRVPLRCDLYVWSESPFMTDMLKLTRGQPVYGPPADMNSFVYAPGLEYLTYLLLAPFGVALDIRWCRVVAILVGAGAALAVALLTAGIARALGTAVPTRATFWLAFGLATLVVFASYTADVPHPDNLHMLHTATTLLLCVSAVRRGSFALAATAMAVGGLGVLAKQPAVLSALGAAAALLVGRRWSRSQAVALVAIGAASTALALVPELWSPEARFFSLGLPARHGLDPTKIITLLNDLGRSHRLVLTLLVGPCAVEVLRRGGIEGQRVMVAWAALGVTAVAPALLPYLKPAGAWNNLTVVMLWFLIPVLLVFVTGLPETAGAATFATPTLRLGLLVVLLVTLVPLQLPPPPAVAAYCDRLVATVGADLRSGRRVLLEHGTTPLIANGIREAPLDRGNTMLEMMMGGQWSRFAAMRERVATWQYDRIYTSGPWSMPYQDLLKRYYRETATIPAPQPTGLAALLPIEWGARFWQGFALTLKVYEPTDDLDVRDGGPDGAQQLAERMRSWQRRQHLLPEKAPAAR